MPDRGERPTRRIVQADALAWMDANEASAGTSVVTSLPDVSELPLLGFDGWRAWFVAAARRVIRWTTGRGVAIFYQSDIRHRGAWVDKGYLVMRAAEEEGSAILWHTIVCRRPPGTVAPGRPSYSHMICVACGVQAARPPGPDVIPDAGTMTWSRAIGLEACRAACRFVRDEVGSRSVVDPFCGRGTVPAVANAIGLDAIGIEISAKRCRAARALAVPGAAAPLAPSLRAALARGGELFDAGEFFAAHEAWEERWRIEPEGSTERRSLQGLIQIAAALHKVVVAGDAAAAARLFARGLAKLEGGALPEVDLARFREEARRCAGAVEGGSFDRSLVPRLGPTP